MTNPTLPFHHAPAPAQRLSRSRPLAGYVLAAPPGGVSNLHEAANFLNSLGSAVGLVSNIPQLSPAQGSNMNAGGTLASAVTSIGILAALCVNGELRKDPYYSAAHTLNALVTSSKAGLDFAAAAGLSNAQTETAQAVISAVSAALQPVIWGTKPSETKALGQEYRSVQSTPTIVPLEGITIVGAPRTYANPAAAFANRSTSPASTAGSYTTADTSMYWTPRRSSSPVQETPHATYARGYERHGFPQPNDTGMSSSFAPAQHGTLGPTPRAKRTTSP
ncbi:hypothetical protein [Jidongwangia harbinensis]|uniref:hypothetical protein n=1 Tax=Jidongwangia harbinensis TaxID=2878561 RepID=UPI001CD995E4|nr:hypothetical protein [Jidongwangia harbinensis]MCA2215153.1 hypothetical protein [Jidongwangia harbinensis]